MMMFTKTAKLSMLKQSINRSASAHTTAVRNYCQMAARFDMMAMQRRTQGLMGQQRTGATRMLTDTPSRGFFGKKKTEEEKVAPKEEAKEEAAPAEEAKEQPAAAEETASEAATEEAKAEEGKDESSTSSSTSEEEGKAEEEPALSAKDVKRIKKLFNEQETEIKSLEKRIKELEAESKRKENEVKLARIEYTKQVKENESTVTRYRKMIEDEKQFAIGKFAKDLLEVRDAVYLAIQHTDVDAITAEEDIQAVKDKFVAQMQGQEMTGDVMDKVLARFNVTSYDPKGEKFDPQLHEAVFTVATSEQENDTVEIVMQTGWKIGDRILRAAKVGIVKK